MQHIGILCFSDFTKEPRVLRTIDALRNHYKLTVFSGENTIPGIETVNIMKYNSDHELASKPGNRFINKFVSFYDQFIKGYRFQSDKYFHRKYWSPSRTGLLQLLESKKPDLLIGHGIYTLPLLGELNIKTVFNAHEYYIREFEENELWLNYEKPYFAYILKTYMQKTDQMFCVCQTIQNDYQKDHPGLKSVVINNARNYADLKPTVLRENDSIKLIHHGAALRGRKLEEIIRIMEFLPANYELNLMLVDSDKGYYDELKATYSKPNIHFIPTVTIEEIPGFINRFDIGVYMLPPTNYNNLAALPNKFFDFIQARLCLCISPNTEMKTIVESYAIGKISKDYTAESMAAVIRSLSVNDINACKQRTHESAAVLSAEANKKIMLETVEKLLN